ncbi:MAG: TetR/AcrR family transcriptional regulator, partial [Gammaproteobacteria bacterium]|nr:TetR/AcrR family transcriptional regulator [Gammaproteobacteria bacterium]
NKRSEILEAAFKVVEQQGANHLTIDAVAKEAGFSKGGVLYHFASKKALLTGMLDHLIEISRSRMDAHQLQGNDNPLAALLHARDEMTAAEQRASLALLVAFAEDTDLLDPARDQFKATFMRVTDGSDNEMEATLLFLANEGLRYLDLFNLNPLQGKERSKVNRYLSKKAGEIS